MAIPVIRAWRPAGGALGLALALDDGTGAVAGAVLADAAGEADVTTEGAALTSASDAGGLDGAAPVSIPEAPAASSRTSTRPRRAATVAIIRLRYVLSRAPAVTTGTAPVAGAATSWGAAAA